VPRRRDDVPSGLHELQRNVHEHGLRPAQLRGVRDRVRGGAVLLDGSVPVKVRAR
jgi:hypothetical protein